MNFEPRCQRNIELLLSIARRHFVFSPSLLWVMTGARTGSRISKPLERLRRKGIDVVRGEIDAIDPNQLQVSMRSGPTMTGDYLIVALGADLAPDAIPGLSQAGHNFYTLVGAESFRDALETFSGGNPVLLTATPAYKCPAAPYEAAMLVEAACRKRGIRDRTEIHLYAAEPGPMGVARLTLVRVQPALWLAEVYPRQRVVA
jgi:sulfide:quinone oxidoreductase